MATKGADKSGMTVSEAGKRGGQKIGELRREISAKEIHNPGYDKPGPAKGTAFGIAAITQALEGLDFPTTKDELLRKAGSKTIEYRNGQPVELRPILEDLDMDEFPSMAQVVQAVSDALKEEGLSGEEHAPAP